MTEYRPGATRIYTDEEWAKYQEYQKAGGTLGLYEWLDFLRTQPTKGTPDYGVWLKNWDDWHRYSAMGYTLPNIAEWVQQGSLMPEQLAKNIAPYEQDVLDYLYSFVETKQWTETQFTQEAKRALELARTQGYHTGLPYFQDIDTWKKDIVAQEKARFEARGEYLGSEYTEKYFTHKDFYDWLATQRDFQGYTSEQLVKRFTGADEVTQRGAIDLYRQKTIERITKEKEEEERINKARWAEFGYTSKPPWWQEGIPAKEQAPPGYTEYLDKRFDILEARAGKQRLARAWQRPPQPEYGRAFQEELVGLQGAEPWRQWFESNYSGMISEFRTTIPEFEQRFWGVRERVKNWRELRAAGVPEEKWYKTRALYPREVEAKVETSWAQYLKKRIPEKKEEYETQYPFGIQGRPWAYAPRVQTVGF